MIYTELTNKAMKLCYRAHEGQFDKSGIPYVFHSFHVAEQFDTEDEVCVALLHDVIEDTSYTADMILAEGFPKHIVEAVECISKPLKMDYMQYIKKVKTNRLARAVKLEDLKHNSDITRIPYMDEFAKKRVEKYRKAMEILLDEDGRE